MKAQPLFLYVNPAKSGNIAGAMKRFLLASLCALLPFGLSAQDATPTPTPSPNRGIWRADLPGGTFVVALSSITSISSHEYVVDNAARVTEVTIGTSGAVVARFYFIEPNIPDAPSGIGQSTINFVQEKLQEGADRSGTDAWKKVVKSYPATTHAHTVEYRLDSKTALQKLQKSAETAWLRGGGPTFKP